MKNKQSIRARLRPAGRALAGLVVACVLAFAVTFSAAGSPPDNDNFANAITLTAASTDATTDEATTETGEPGVAAPLQFANVNTSRTVWWKWTAPSTAKYTFAATSLVTDPTIGVFTGSSVNSLTELASSARADHDTGYESRVFLDATSGTDYYIQVGVSPADPSGAFTLKWAANSVPNDDFVNAIALGQDDGARPGWNVGATVQPPDEPRTTTCCIDHTVWYAYTPSLTGSWDLQLDRDFPSELNVYTGSSLAGLAYVSGPGRIDVAGGTTYYIQIGTSDGGPGTFLLRWSLDTRPINDDFASADDLFGGQTVDGQTIAASTESGEPTSVTGHAGVRSVWYQWFPGGSGPATVSVDAVQDVPHAPLVQLYSTSSADPTFADLTPIGTHDPGLNDPVDTVHATVDGSAVYYIQVLGDLTAEQDVSFDFTLSAQFDNDLFANATQIAGANGTLTGTTVGATFPESGEPDPSGAIDNTVWYAWTAPANGPATFTVDTGFDGAAAVYTGGAVDSLVPVADDSDSSSLSLQFTAQAGQTYHVQVGTYDDSPDTFTLHWHLTVRPSNDDLTDATTIDGSSIDGTTKNATLESLEPTNVDVSGTPHTGSNSVWYRWSPGDTGSAELTVTPDVEIDNPHNALVQVYDGPATVLSFDDLTPVGTHPAADTTDADVETGSFYYVQVMSNDTPTNPNFDFTLDIQVSAPAPPNDDWATAAAISEDVGSADGTNVDATTEAGEPLALHTPSVVATHDTVWWKWVAPSDGRYQFDTADTNVDTVLGVFTGSGVNALTEVTSNDDDNGGPWQSRVRFTAVGGTTYYFQVGSYSEGDTGPFTLEWSHPPVNDDFAGAIAFGGDTGPLNGSNVGGTLQSEPDPTGGDIANTVWYAWTPASTGHATISFDAGFLGSLAVYSGSALNSLTRLASDYDGTSLTASFNAVAGRTYHVQVGSYFDSPGPFTLDWSITIVPPAHYVVTTTGDGVNDANCLVSSCTLRQAVNAARAGFGADTIDVPAGTYQLSASFGALVIDAGMTITGAGARTTTIVAPARDRVLDVAAAGTPVAIKGFTLRGGTADENNGFFGGDVRSSGDLTLTEVTVTGGSASSGGGLSNNGGTMLVVRSTVSGNQALLGGGDSGGIQNFGDNGIHHGALTVRNSTITGNTARLGGAILSWNDQANTVVVENSTIAGNTATDRGIGGVGGDGSFSYKGSILAGNVFVQGPGGPSNCSGTIVSLGGNLESGTDCRFTAAGDRQSTDPLLGPLADNGGPTDTLALPKTSPAVDALAGCPPPSVDQRGIARPQGASCDIGAFELVSGPANDDWAGRVTLGADSGSVNGTTVNSTLEGGEPDPDDGLGGSVWYSWTPSRDGIATLSLNAPFVAMLAAYVGGPVGELSVRAHDSGTTTPVVRFAVSAGTEYSIQVGAAFGQTPAAFGLGWGLSVAPGAPTLSTATPGNGSVALDWLPPEQNGGTPITGYLVYRGTSPGGEELLTQLENVTTYTDASVTNGTTYFYKVVAVNGVGGGALSNELSATPAAPRDIAGSVLDANGGAVAGVAVRACLGLTCLDTTTSVNGGFAFLSVAPGVYVVRALPSDPSVLAVQTDADVRDQSARELTLRLTASGAGSTDAGPSSFRVTGCQGGTLHYVANGDGVSLGSGDVADGAGNTPVDGVYTIDVSSLNAGHAAMLQLDITITCSDITEHQTALLFADPSGTVVDDTAGTPLAGATVTLLDGAGNAIPAGDPRLSPATSSNPETSDARGAWGWDVAPGTYRVSATKESCGTTTSGPLTVTPTSPVSNVVLHLACPGPPAPTPTPTPPSFPPAPPTPPTTLPDPIADVNFNVVPIAGTVLVNGQVLPNGQQIPFGADIDATNGIVSITTIGPDGKPQTAFFYGGEFILTLDPDGVTTLVLKGGDFSVCGTATTTKTKVKGTKKRKTQAAVAAGAKAASNKVIRAVWGTGKGSFRTKGRYSSATVRGTLWYHADRCDGTYTQVNEGVVTVLDIARKRILIVRAGHSVLVRPK